MQYNTATVEARKTVAAEIARTTYRRVLAAKENDKQALEFWRAREDQLTKQLRRLGG